MVFVYDIVFGIWGTQRGLPEGFLEDKNSRIDLQCIFSLDKPPSINFIILIITPFRLFSIVFDMTWYVGLLNVDTLAWLTSSYLVVVILFISMLGLGGQPLTIWDGLEEIKKKYVKGLSSGKNWKPCVHNQGSNSIRLWPALLKYDWRIWRGMYPKRMRFFYSLASLC